MQSVNLYEDPTIYIDFVLDCSGSMNLRRNDVISTVSKQLDYLMAEQEEKNITYKVSVKLFNDSLYNLTDGHLPLTFGTIASINNLLRVHFKPSGNTALYDATGTILTSVLSKVEYKEDINNIMYIYTDGYENASKEYSKAGVMAVIEKFQKRGGAVVFMCEGVESFKDYASMGVLNVNRVTNFLDILTLGQTARSNYINSVRSNVTGMSKSKVL